MSNLEAINEAIKNDNSEDLEHSLLSLDREATLGIFKHDSEFPPLILAALYGSSSCMKLLIKSLNHLDSCDNDDLKLTKRYINQQRKGGMAPLHYAVREKSYLCVQLLLEAGADPNILDDDGFEGSPLHIACELNYLEILKLLILFGGKIDLRSNKLNITPFYNAVSNNSFECAEYLISLGAKVMDRSLNEYTPLHYSQLSERGNSTECTKLLLKHGADVNAKNQSGETPLHYAAEKYNDKAIKLLLSYGADVNVQSKRNGNTPLHYAIPRRCQIDEDFDFDHALEVVNILLDHHSNLELKNCEGNTPLYVAATESSLDIAKALLDHGANVNTVGKNGMLLLDYVLYQYKEVFLRGGGWLYSNLCDLLYDYVDDEGKRRIDEVRQLGKKRF